MRSVSQTVTLRNLVVVELTENVLVQTTIPSESHPALRSGFAGYPANPRWNASKFCAWKTGCMWRRALCQGEMVVRQSDSMLVLACEIEENITEDLCLQQAAPTTKKKWSHFPSWAKQLINSYQTV